MSKRKSDAMDMPKGPLIDLTNDADIHRPADNVPAAKKARVSDASEPGKSVAKVTQAAVEDDEEDDEGPIYDDCNDIRRKITAYLKEPGVKVTAWLREIGVNSNSYNRFMKAKGPTGGVGNGTYEAAYYFFEARRIAAGKPKTKKRLQNEEAHYNGFELRERTHVWVRG